MGKNEVRVGKGGITEGIINEIKRRLEIEKEIKVRINRNLLEQGKNRREIAEQIASLCGAELVEIRGHTFVLRSAKLKNVGILQ
ncbi:MAG: YhbY family RNA-binding protein [Fervidicoccaceae archaeon]